MGCLASGISMNKDGRGVAYAFNVGWVNGYGSGYVSYASEYMNTQSGGGYGYGFTSGGNIGGGGFNPCSQHKHTCSEELGCDDY